MTVACQIKPPYAANDAKRWCLNITRSLILLDNTLTENNLIKCSWSQYHNVRNLWPSSRRWSIADWLYTSTQKKVSPFRSVLSPTTCHVPEQSQQITSNELLMEAYWLLWTRIVFHYCWVVCEMWDYFNRLLGYSRFLPSQREAYSERNAAKINMVRNEESINVPRGS